MWLDLGDTRMIGLTELAYGMDMRDEERELKEMPDAWVWGLSYLVD